MEKDSIQFCGIDDVVLKLSKLRQSSGITLDFVADQLMTGKSAISRLERREHSPCLRTLINYAQSIGYKINVSLEKIKND
jgi:transcriptional regulator with XRE-family HTH domain